MDDFVTYDIAVKLKEKGFDWTCMAHFNNIIYNEPTLNYNVTVDDIRGSNFKSLNKLDSFIDAPTISQVLKWLREEKGLHIEIRYTFSEETLWDFEVLRIGSYKGWLNNRLPLNSYEQAALAGIDYVLNNLM